MTDDPIALAAERDMWKERALIAEAQLSRTVPVHNHGPDDGYGITCQESYVNANVTICDC